jgi:hypothetical protein
LEFILDWLSAVKSKDKIISAYKNVYIDMSKFGESYRNITELDRIPPKNQKTQEILRNSGVQSLLELKMLFKSELEEYVLKLNNEDEIDNANRHYLESLWTFTALIDLRELKDRSDLDTAIKEFYKIIN